MVVYSSDKQHIQKSEFSDKTSFLYSQYLLKTKEGDPTELDHPLWFL